VTVASPSCSSDETLKTNIVDLPHGTLDSLLSVRTVSYGWKNYTNKGTQIGFLAQDLERVFPEVVSKAPNGYLTVSYGGVTPILVQALREMNMKIEGAASMDMSNALSVGSLVKNMLSDASNAIEVAFFGEVHAKKLCLEDVCVTKVELERILQTQGSVVPVVQSSTLLEGATPLLQTQIQNIGSVPAEISTQTPLAPEIQTQTEPHVQNTTALPETTQ
jgi:phage FluMu protein gp41